MAALITPNLPEAEVLVGFVGAGMGGGGALPAVGDQDHLGPLFDGKLGQLQDRVFIAADIKDQQHIPGRQRQQ